MKNKEFDSEKEGIVKRLIYQRGVLGTSLYEGNLFNDFPKFLGEEMEGTGKQRDEIIFEVFAEFSGKPREFSYSYDNNFDFIGFGNVVNFLCRFAKQPGALRERIEKDSIERLHKHEFLFLDINFKQAMIQAPLVSQKFYKKLQELLVKSMTSKF